MLVATSQDHRDESASAAVNTAQKQRDGQMHAQKATGESAIAPEKAQLRRRMNIEEGNRGKAERASNRTTAAGNHLTAAGEHANKPENATYSQHPPHQLFYLTFFDRQLGSKTGVYNL